MHIVSAEDKVIPSISAFRDIISSKRSKQGAEAGRDHCLAHIYFNRSETGAGLLVLQLKDSNSVRHTLLCP